MASTKYFIALLLILGTILPADQVHAGVEPRVNPFVLAWRGSADFPGKVRQVRKSLLAAGFQIVAELSPFPATDYVDDLRILVFTGPQIKRNAARSRHGGFAAAQRIAITRKGNDVQVAYVNPVYMAYAYRLKGSMADIADRLAGSVGRQQVFGSHNGLTEQQLRNYHYTFGMEYFDDTYELARYSSYSEAVTQVNNHLATNRVGIGKAYSLDIPGKQETLIGVLRKGTGVDGRYHDDHWIMRSVDGGELYTTAYLPYEILITGNRVIALHQRFRMAVFHPDLKMRGKNSLFNILPGAGLLGETLAAAVGGQIPAREKHAAPPLTTR